MTFGYYVGGVSAVSLFCQIIIFGILCKFRPNKEFKDREMILRAIDGWVVKELTFYVVVVITFLLIGLDQGDNMIVGTIIGGIVTFIILFLWRTSQGDHLERIRPKDSAEEV